MASSPKFLSPLFLLILLSWKVHARESQFFSKFSASTVPTVAVNNGDKSNVEWTTVPSKEEDEQPSFLPESQSYGLYGEESKKVPTSTTTTKLGNELYRGSTYVPYTTGTNQETHATSNNNHINNYYENTNAFEEDQQENLGETSLQQTGYNPTNSNQNTNNNNYYYSDAYGNTEKQGMSDTRFLENGKYYHDVKNENKYYTNPNQNQNSGYNYDTSQVVQNEHYVP
ncbi:hypothetical protein K2173_000755 [Erythroxylum novogranatense]|uniref:Protein E6-like n=1 Tax=Erythroxylum novogranatense TaxID=1862640 RepID=A0AAV8T2U1_9ROSI|nr:hypothetical protein K2173_000755 [Erythroxylum novogranatense]